MSTTNHPAPHVHVACAIIRQDGLVLAAQRSANMNLPLKWEFPGGKLEAGETPAQCLKRELVEELDIQIRVGWELPLYTHHYPSFTVTLYPFACSIESGEITLHEHAAMVWLAPEKLHTLDWAEADLPLIGEYLRRVKGQPLAAGETVAYI